jgi:hypothetical protein
MGCFHGSLHKTEIPYLSEMEKKKIASVPLENDVMFPFYFRQIIFVFVFDKIPFPSYVFILSFFFVKKYESFTSTFIPRFKSLMHSTTLELQFKFLKSL